MQQIVTAEKLEEIAALLGTPDSASRNGASHRNEKAIDLPAKLSEWNINFTGPRDFNGSDKKFLGIGSDPCWFGGAHSAGACAAAQFATGAVAAWCLHQSCSGLGWKDLRKPHEPNYDPDRKASARSAPSALADSGLPLLKADAPFDIADAFVAARFTLNGVRTVHHWQGSFWQWCGACFDGISDGEIRAAVGNYLHQDVDLVAIDKKGNEDHADPTSWHVRNVSEAMMALTNLSAKDITPPQWLGEAEGSKSARLVAVRNGLLDLETRETLSAFASLFQSERARRELS